MGFLKDLARKASEYLDDTSKQLTDYADRPDPYYLIADFGDGEPRINMYSNRVQFDRALEMAEETGEVKVKQSGYNHMNAHSDRILKDYLVSTRYFYSGYIEESIVDFHYVYDVNQKIVDSLKNDDIASFLPARENIHFFVAYDSVAAFRLHTQQPALDIETPVKDSDFENRTNLIFCDLIGRYIKTSDLDGLIVIDRSTGEWVYVESDHEQG